MSRIVGLTGGIGSGKSTVARMLAGLGAVVIDSDAIVRELQVAGGPMLADLARAFGAEILLPDGSLDRARLGQLAFSDPELRRRLGEITHPAVGREVQLRLAAARAAGVLLIVVDNPLLFEGRARRAQAAPPGNATRTPEEETILVYAPAEVQIARQQTRDGVTREFALQRLAAQLPIEEKRALATHVIDNSGALAETQRQVRALHAKLIAPR